MCLGKPFPPDIRVEKEARTLAGAGHQLFVLSPHRAERLVEEDIGYATLLRWIPQQPFVLRAWRFAHMALRGMDPLWRRHIERAVSERNVEAIHVHDLPLVNTGLRVARPRGLPLVADLHENYPELITFHQTSFRGKLANLLISQGRWRRFEKSCLQQADRIITVVDEIKDHYVRDHGIPHDKVTIVMNTEDLDRFLSIPIDGDIIRQYEPFFVLSYIGGFGLHRGVQTAILAMPRVLETVPGARLILVGGGGNEPELRNLARSLGLGGVVEFIRWQPFEKVPSYIAASKVGLVPYIKSVQTNASAPHKLFQYMALARPLVVSSMASLSRIMTETGAGLVYRAGDATALADAVISIYRDKNLAADLGQAGLNAVRTKYNWQMEGAKLLELYDRLRR